MATLRDLAGGFMGMGGRKRPTTGGIKSPYTPGMTSATGPYMDDSMAQGSTPTGGSAGTPTDGGGYSSPPPPTRYPPILPTYAPGDVAPNYATTPQTPPASLTAPWSPGTPSAGGPMQRPPYSADPPPMGGGMMYPGGSDTFDESAGNGMGFQRAGVPPGTGGIKPAPGYSPAPYDPSTDPLAQGSPSTPGSGNFGGFLTGPYTPPPMAMTAPGPGMSGGANRVRPPSAQDRGAFRDAMQDPALKSQRQARVIEILKNNPNFASDPRMMQMLRQEDLQDLLKNNPGIAGNANFGKVNKARMFTPEEIAAYNAAKGM